MTLTSPAEWCPYDLDRHINQVEGMSMSDYWEDTPSLLDHIMENVCISSVSLKLKKGSLSPDRLSCGFVQNIVNKF